MARSKDSQGALGALRIRALDPERLPAVMEIEKEAFPHDTYPTRLMLDYLRADPEGFLVAEVAGKIVGYIIASALDEEARVVSMAVARAWRRREIGKALLERVLQRFVESGFDEVELEVRPDNVAAISLYEAMGFSLERVIPHYYEVDGSPGNVMKKKLHPPRR